MTDKSEHTRTKLPEGVERKDAATVAAVVSAGAAVVNTGLAIHQARQSGKPKTQPKKDK